MTSPHDIARGIFVDLADRAGSGLDSWDSEIKEDCINEIDSALREYGEAEFHRGYGLGETDGKKLQYCEDWKKADAEGFRRGYNEGVHDGISDSVHCKEHSDAAYRRGVEETSEIDRVCRQLLRVIDRATYVTEENQTPILRLLRMRGVKLYKALQRSTGGGE